MLSRCRLVRLCSRHASFASALAAAHAPAHADASISTSDSDLDPESRVPADSEPLRCRMRALAAEGNLFAALDALGRLRPAAAAPDCNALLHAYLRSERPDAERVAAVISHMRRFGPAPNALTFNTAFNGLLRLGHLHAAHAVLEQMWSGCGFTPSFTAVDRLIKKALGCSDSDLALKVFDLMLSLCYLPTLPVANAVVSVLLKSGGSVTAYEVFMVLVNRSFVPDKYIYNQILFGLCKSGCGNKALALFCNLKKRGLSLNVYSYTALVLGFCKEKMWGEAFRTMAKMCDEGCKPSVVTYTVVVDFLCKDGKTDDAMHVFRMACQEGCCLDSTICNVLLHALCCEDRILEARGIVDLMEEAGLVPDYFTVSSLAAGFLKAGHVKTCQNFIRMVKKALDLVSGMMERGFLPSTATCNTILKGFCMELDLQRALQMLDHFGSTGILYDSVSFNTILSAACRQQNASVIRMVLYRMYVEGINLDTISMTCLLRYFHRCGSNRKRTMDFIHGVVVSLAIEGTQSTG
uniref:Pentacotripeptide-repeat region of PRORP domain-containing protein n=1 Tax=Leersia perrieri TaxID=77586 RepID=A0A0D9W4M7_9ORYZ